MHTLYDDLLDKDGEPSEKSSEMPIFLLTKDKTVILLYKHEVIKISDINLDNIENFIINIFNNWKIGEDIRKLIPSYVKKQRNIILKVILFICAIITVIILFKIIKKKN